MRQIARESFAQTHLLLMLCLFTGCSGGASERQAAVDMKELGAVVVNDVNKRASALVLPKDAEKIKQATPLIPKLVYLTSFSGMNTPITDDTLVAVAQLKSLTNVDLSGTQITNSGVGHLVGLKNLSSLSLADSKVTDGCLKDLGRLTNLKILNLAKNEISGGFEHLVSCKQLTWLMLSHLTLSDEDAAALATCPSLKRLTVTTEVDISEIGIALLRAKGIQVDVEAQPETNG